MNAAVEDLAADNGDAIDVRAIDRALAQFLQRQFPQVSEAQGKLAGYVSRQLAQGHLCLPINLQTSRQEVERYCGEALEELLINNPLISNNGSTPLVLDGNRLYLLRYWRLEKQLAAAVHARLSESLLEPSAIKTPLARLFAESVEQPDWQKIACALVGRTRLGIITGGPGTGKTTTVVKLLALLQQLAIANGKPLLIELAAPTGKAANRLETSIGNAIGNLAVGRELKQKLPNQVKTLHRLLGTQRHSRHFRHNHRNPLIADLVVVDEASMVDIDMMVALLDALPQRCRLILVGDKDQLASVEAGAVMSELCAAADVLAYEANTRDFVATAAGVSIPAGNASGSELAQQTVKLQKNWRSMNAPGINVLAQAVNRQDVAQAKHAFDDYPQQLRRQKRSSGWIKRELVDGADGIAALLQRMRETQPDTTVSKAQVDAWARGLLDRITRQQLLTPLRRGPDGVEGLNERIIARLQRGSLIDSTRLFPGMPLLVTSNLYDLGLMNGDLGLLLIHPVLGERVAFATRDGMRWILPDQLENCSQPAYALSVHQSQGSEFNRVLLHLPDGQISAQARGILTKELVYTAVTRASATFVLLEGADSLLESAIKNRTQRHSGLGDRLHGLRDGRS